MILSAGIDVGTGAIKFAVFQTQNDHSTLLGLHVEKIRKRDPIILAKEGYHYILKEVGIAPEEIHYLATTGDGDMIDFSTGHFYSMTAHARGALYLCPNARSVVDIGALHTRALQMDDRSKVLQYKMTSQCASGSGQFLENIVRYLGISTKEVGELSMQSKNPERVSSICAVLAETDVINMVSRGISTPDILKGIHLSMAGRIVKLLKSMKVNDTVFLAGGLAADEGLKAAIIECFEKEGDTLQVLSNENSIYAGAIGTAIWGAYRYQKIQNN